MSQVARRRPPPGVDPAAELAGGLHAMLTALVERTPLFADLRRRGIAEDLVQDTLLTVTRRIGAGHVIDDPYAYAARCVTNLAKRTYIRGGRETAMSDAALEVLAPAVEDVADRVHQRMTMREVLEMIRSVNVVIAELEPLQLAIVRAELARTDQKQLAATLGISRPTLYRRKAPAIAAFVAAVAQRAGTSPCAEHAGALLAAAGDSGFDGARAAAAHAEHCEHCRETIRHLAVAKHGLALIAPIPFVITRADPAGAFERAQGMLHGAGDWLRQLALRVGDPAPLGGSAAKTATIVAAACTGGGGLYCAVQGIPAPLKEGFSHHAAVPARPKTKPAPHATGATIQPTAGVIGQVATTVRVVERRDAAAKHAAAARRRRRARARAQTAREFALRHPSVRSGTTEFTPLIAPTGVTITRREFVEPNGTGASGSAPTVTEREFGAP